MYCQSSQHLAKDNEKDQSKCPSFSPNISTQVEKVNQPPDRDVFGPSNLFLALLDYVSRAHEIEIRPRILVFSIIFVFSIILGEAR